MKTRFNTYDIVCTVSELQRLIGMRVNQVYDIDNKTYLIRLQRSEEKSVLLLDSGNRFHTTQFEWPKNVAPSGFTMKLRKHLKNKRLEHMQQLGIDRIVDFQFGSGEAAYHVILELYDRGNIVLTDHEFTILNVLRPHLEGDKIRFAVKEKYPLDRAKPWHEPPTGEALKEILSKSKPGDNLKKILNPNLEYGPAIIDHVLLEQGLSGNMKLAKDPDGKGFYLDRDFSTLETAIRQAEELLQTAKNNMAKGYIIQKKEVRPNPDNENDTNYLLTNLDFHPMLYAQHKDAPYIEFESFDRAIDEFYSALEGQKIDVKTIQVERDAYKKLQNVRKDHEKRLTELEKTQQLDREKAELITRNQGLVDQARIAVQTALANQMPWEEIKQLVKTAQERNDPIASVIKTLKLNINHITLELSDPYEDNQPSDDEDDEGLGQLKPMLIDIDLSLTAFANARRYYDQKRNAAKKQRKTLESQDKALKSAERKTKQTLKEAQTISNITKARKTYWFEKFFWFISSDNYLVIGGRDQQQNELLVKRYMRGGDIYVHADLSGAASIIIKNAGAALPPPRTLNEAGQAAIAYSVAWEAKVLTSAWWVRASQVSKSAPTGEYLTTGSFMIRGKKTYLLPQHLMLGFSFMFRLEESSIDRHRGERKALVPEDTVSEVASTVDHDEEIVVSDNENDASDDESKVKDSQLETISEETKIEIKERDGHTQDDINEGDENTHNDNKLQDDSESDDSSDVDFPDTHIKVDHGTGEVIIESKARTISEVSERSDGKLDEEKLLTFPALPNKKGGKKSDKENNKNAKKTEDVRQKDMPKRGQKSKLKKIKEKYKDQDEEERLLRMELLKSAAMLKESKKAQKKTNSGGKSKGGTRQVKIPQPPPLILEADSEPEQEEIEVDTQAADADTELLAQLTGAPMPEDELLFAVPVVAPYTALQNYKYRVKLTPGTGRRGKAARTAVQVFVRGAAGGAGGAAAARERDLLRAVRDEDAARNFPGKVKLSAPQLHRHKK